MSALPILFVCFSSVYTFWLKGIVNGLRWLHLICDEPVSNPNTAVSKAGSSRRLPWWFHQWISSRLFWERGGRANHTDGPRGNFILCYCPSWSSSSLTGNYLLLFFFVRLRWIAEWIDWIGRSVDLSSCCSGRPREREKGHAYAFGRITRMYLFIDGRTDGALGQCSRACVSINVV